MSRHQRRRIILTPAFGCGTYNQRAHEETVFRDEKQLHEPLAGGIPVCRLRVEPVLDM